MSYSREFDLHCKNDAPIEQNLQHQGRWYYDANRVAGSNVEIHYQTTDKRWITLPSDIRPYEVPHLAIAHKEIEYGDLGDSRGSGLEKDEVFSRKLEVRRRVLYFIKGFGIEALKADDLFTVYNAVDVLTGGILSDDYLSKRRNLFKETLRASLFDDIV